MSWPFTDSPDHADVGATIADLFEVMGGYLHLDDADHVLFALAVAVSAELDVPPLCGMLVGAPSGGKTEAIEALRDRAVHLDELTAPGLLSWQPAKPAPKPTGALTGAPSSCPRRSVAGFGRTLGPHRAIALLARPSRSRMSSARPGGPGHPDWRQGCAPQSADQ